MLHRFTARVSGIELPQQFTFPFHYSPHPLCVEAASEVRACVSARQAWREELQRGKMLGVLVVSDAAGQLGFLAAFSGNLCGSNQWDYFVPPVYDLLDPDGEFKRGEAKITSINHAIAAIERDSMLQALQRQADAVVERRDRELAEWRAFMARSKAKRDALRGQGALSPELEQELVAESQYQKAQLKRLKRHHEGLIAPLNRQLQACRDRIALLKRQRKAMSEALQERIFQLFVVCNARGEKRNLMEVFRQYYGESVLPPAGAGECCAPKLLQYAFLNDLRPVAMAEFWWGESPEGEVRHDGHYYPACLSKCRPILAFMLQGLDVEPNPLAAECRDKPIEVVYDDEWIAVVNKPAGLLTTPGKLQRDSLLTRLKARFTRATGPLAVHRLDQMTSGLVLVAKTSETYRSLQSQFASHSVRKRYIALLDGLVAQEQGFIDLPLCLDLNDRPRQKVSFRHGKRALTRWEVISREKGKTRVAFFPVTGRTHQLRVHASHPLGLNAPIVGDMLYGTAASRLYLHAEAITFTHPVTRKDLTVVAPAPF